MSTSTEIWQALRQDYTDLCEQRGDVVGNAYAVGVFATAAATVPYLFGGLATTLGWVGSRVLETTHSALATGVADGAVSLSVELGLTLLYGSLMRRFSHTATVLEEKKYAQRREPEQRTHRLRAIGNAAQVVGLAAAAGSPGVMVRSFVRTPGENHIRKGVRTAMIMGGCNTILSTGIGEGLVQSEWILHWAGKGWPFAVLFMGPHAIKAAKNAIVRRIRRPGETEGSSEA